MRVASLAVALLKINRSGDSPSCVRWARLAREDESYDKHGTPGVGEGDRTQTQRGAAATPSPSPRHVRLTDPAETEMGELLISSKHCPVE